MKPISTVTRWFDSLQSRERWVVAGGTLLVSLTILWVLFDSVLSERSEARQAHAQLLADMDWMKEQAEVMSRLQNSCPQMQIQPARARDFITRQSERNALQVIALTAASSSGTRLQVRGADGNGILRLAHQLVCQGYSLQSLSIQREVTSGLYDGQLEVVHDS